MFLFSVKAFHPFLFPAFRYRFVFMLSISYATSSSHFIIKTGEANSVKVAEKKSDRCPDVLLIQMEMSLNMALAIYNIIDKITVNAISAKIY